MEDDGGRAAARRFADHMNAMSLEAENEATKLVTEKLRHAHGATISYTTEEFAREIVQLVEETYRQKFE